jgi:peroxiredoxin
VLIFFWHDCPICNSYATEINRLARQYTHFFFYIVQVDPDLSAPAARRHAADYSLTPPVLLDPRHQLVRLTGAKVTPEAFVLGANQTVLYHGRIDNLYPSLSRRLPEATVHDLAMALDSIAAGRPATSSEPAIGCLIQ